MNDAALEARIEQRARACGIELPAVGAAALALHARRVLEAAPGLKLTAIREPEEFVERHIGESLEGAALLEAGAEGPLLDLGSGNGYPGVPLAITRPALRLVLAESSQKKAAFLAGVIRELPIAGARVMCAHVERADDLATLAPLRALVTRAVGGWERIVPRLASRLAAEAHVLLWAGADAEAVIARAAWSKLVLVDRRALPGRDRSWIWHLRPV